MIIMPPKLTNLLNGISDEISAAVGSAISAVHPILERNEAPFFPDYTDHGQKHIESVLRTCELLISDEAWSVFTREDAAVLILATLAHDLGMLITADGFQVLVDPLRNDNLLSESNDEPWHKLWREFQLEARRFDGAMLIKLVGAPEPVPMEELDLANLSARGIKIVGEFLRRHHYRLAHEIVLFGMPAANGRVLLFDRSPQHLRDLAGIVARSHGVAIRECIEILIKQNRTGHREFRHVHPAFLMTLVRLADYLDLDIGRAPASVLAAKTLKSPISRREWWAHRAIVDCHSFSDDPECLHVVVEPAALPNIATFSVVEEKVIGIQQELDSCWAILGEVYGRFPPLNKLTIKVRRIRSDLRESSTIQQLAFVPHKASLASARSDLLKLLIEPLYGDRPGIGIRELIQNAIDAVREIDFILSKTVALMPLDRADIDGDVVVSFEKDNHDDYWVTIDDRGIGMTWETVAKYYLTAGASFRQSNVWKKRFTEESGTSLVLRSGRFGIGVLAAFLLGDRVIVSTRHVEDPIERGIEFEFGLDDTEIEMRWVKRKVGTTVKIRTSETIVKRLHSLNKWMSDSWDWYCLEKPVLTRRDINGNVLKQKYKLPVADGEMPAHWHRIEAPGYQAVYWSHNHNIPEIVCNGIIVPHGSIAIVEQFGKKERYFDYRDNHLIIDSPKLSVFDPDGRLPLTLARDKLARTPDFASSLVDDVCRNFIAYCLCKGPDARMLHDDQFSIFAHSGYPGFNRYNYCSPLGQFFDTENGFGLSDPWNMSSLTVSTGLLFRVTGRHLQLSQSIADIVEPVCGFMYGIGTNGSLTDFDYWHKRLILYNDKSECLPAFKGLKTSGIRTLMPYKWYERLVAKQPKYIINSIKVCWKTNDWVIWTVGDCQSTDDTLVSIANDLQKTKEPVESVTEYYLLPSDIPKPGRIAQIWQQVIGGPIIPYDKTERQRIMASLDEQFKGHLAEWTFKRARMVKRRSSA